MNNQLSELKVLVATESFGQLNGVSRATLAFCAYLKRQGANFSILAPAGRNLLAHDADYPLLRLRGIPFPTSPDLRVVTPFFLGKQLHGEPNVVYLASPASLGLMVWLQTRRRLPIVVNYQTELSDFARATLPRPLRYLASRAIDRLTVLIFNDHAVRAVLATRASFAYLKRIGVRETKLRPIQRGVDTTLFNPEKRSAELRRILAPNGEDIILYVGRLAFEKNLALLAEVNRCLLAAQQAGALRPFRLVIVGGNDNSGVAERIQALFADQPNVTFTGPKVGEDLAAHYASADIFAFPALHETFGQVVQEAMASGLAVVAMNSGGPATIVQQGVTGYLCEPSHAATQMSDYTAHLLLNPAPRAAIAQEARRFTEQRSWDDVNQQILDLLMESADAHPASPTRKEGVGPHPTSTAEGLSQKGSEP